ncbi:hypothetical protein A3F06_00665 [candidate division TM6 bacterium RIFCSPHIGHO2_12_FULL_36_22]|nr:MAG: hypothetical protein A3F06_00665 [candidate division TM6 bacterium RIFCSPHIGHO2_12_FULL_36_22]
MKKVFFVAILFLILNVDAGSFLFPDKISTENDSDYNTNCLCVKMDTDEAIESADYQILERLCNRFDVVSKAAQVSEDDLQAFLEMTDAQNEKELEVTVLQQLHDCKQTVANVANIESNFFNAWLMIRMRDRALRNRVLHPNGLSQSSNHQIAGSWSVSYNY